MDTSRTRSSWNQKFQFQTKPKFRDEYWKSTNLISSPSKPNWNLLRPGMNSSEYSAILQIIPWTGVSWVLKILMSAKKGSNRISVEIPNHHESFSIKTYLISWACGCSTGGWCSCSVRFHWSAPHNDQWPTLHESLHHPYAQEEPCFTLNQINQISFISQSYGDHWNLFIEERVTFHSRLNRNS